MGIATKHATAGNLSLPQTSNAWAAHRFLYAVSVLLYVLGGLVGVLSVGFAAYIASQIGVDSPSFWLSLLLGAAYSIPLFVAGALIKVAVEIAENTRLTAEILRRSVAVSNGMDSASNPPSE